MPFKLPVVTEMDLQRARKTVCLLTPLKGLSDDDAEIVAPNKPIRVLVGYAPGGGSDIIARLVAQNLQTRLGQPVIGVTGRSVHSFACRGR